MNDIVRRTAWGLLLAVCAPSAIDAQFHEEIDSTEISLSGQTTESIILAWPTYSYRLARMMIAKYGQPAEVGDARLVWLDNGPWKKTVVHRAPPSGRVFQRNKGRLEQSVAYRVPADKLDALARFDGDIEADQADGRLIARSDSESANFLALNLADEVIKGKRSPQEASAFRRRLTRLQPAGKFSSYLDGLMF